MGDGRVKRKVLRWRLKLSNDGEYLIGRGISFHIWGEAEEKADQLMPNRKPWRLTCLTSAVVVAVDKVR